MSDFFKAAAKCDASLLSQAPMYIDKRVVQEEQFKREALIAQVLKTRLLLERVDASMKELDQQTHGPADAVPYAVAPSYVPPGTIDTKRDPSLRAVGSTALRQRAEARLAAERERLQQARLELQRVEESEKASSAAGAAERRRQAARELDASTAAAAAADAQRREEAEQREALERAKRERKHPIDVFQSRVALDIVSEVAGHDAANQTRILAAHQTVDDIIDKEKAGRLRYAFRGPSTHIPTGF